MVCSVNVLNAPQFSSGALAFPFLPVCVWRQHFKSEQQYLTAGLNLWKGLWAAVEMIPCLCFQFGPDVNEQ